MYNDSNYKLNIYIYIYIYIYIIYIIYNYRISTHTKNTPKGDNQLVHEHLNRSTTTHMHDRGTIKVLNTNIVSLAKLDVLKWIMSL